MQSRAWKKLDCIFTLSRWILLACLLSLISRGVIAQNESETFESAFGLNLPESIENQSTEGDASLPPQTKEELEDFTVEEKDLTSVEKKDDVANPVQVLSEVENTFTAKGDIGVDSLSVRKASGRTSKEKTGKYVRYGE